MSYTADRLRSWNLSHKRVFVRIDGNVPCSNGVIIDDYKLKQTMPTINWILNRGGSVFIATHMGKDQSTNQLLSTKIITDWLVMHGIQALYAPDYQSVQAACESGAVCVVLENERLQGVLTDDQASVVPLCSYYVNDAFGSLHRSSWSLTDVPQQFALSDRSCGFLVEQELRVLTPLAQAPAHPYVIIAGGNKAEKLITLAHLADRADALLLCPRLSSIYTGHESTDSQQVHQACEQLRRQFAKKVHLPTDYVSLSSDTAQTVVSIGPRTAEIYAEIISRSASVVFNGLGGFLEKPETLESTAVLFEAMAQSSGISLVAGGDSSAAARALGFGERMSLISTGGGATMYYLATGKLPALAYVPEH